MDAFSLAAIPRRTNRNCRTAHASARAVAEISHFRDARTKGAVSDDQASMSESA